AGRRAGAPVLAGARVPGPAQVRARAQEREQARAADQAPTPADRPWTPQHPPSCRPWPGRSPRTTRRSRPGPGPGPPTSSSVLNPGGPETGALCPLVPPSCDAPWRIPLPLGHTGAKPDGPGFSCSLPWLDLLAERLSRHIGSVTIRFPTREGIPMASVLLLAQDDFVGTVLHACL